MSTAQETENVITLKGSTEIVAEFFYYSINSILYQRGIYPAASFDKQAKYGLTMLVTKDDQLNLYLEGVGKQLQSWLLNDKVQRLVLVITGIDSGDVLERWAFNVHSETPAVLSERGNAEAPKKSVKAIHGEIQAIIRQITASVTFLPLLSEPCSFDLLVYADKDATVPRQWEESDPCKIPNQSEVRLRSFSTRVHKVDGMVAFRNTDDDDDL